MLSAWRQSFNPQITQIQDRFYTLTRPYLTAELMSFTRGKRFKVNLFLNLRIDLADEGVAAQEILADVSDGVVQCLAGIARAESQFACSLAAV